MARLFRLMAMPRFLDWPPNAVVRMSAHLWLFCRQLSGRFRSAPVTLLDQDTGASPCGEDARPLALVSPRNSSVPCHGQVRRISSLKPPGSDGRFVSIVAGPSELVGHSLDGHNPMGTGTLALVVALDLRVVTHRKVRRLHKGPGQVLVAVLGVSTALTLAVAQVLAADASAVGGGRPPLSIA